MNEVEGATHARVQFYPQMWHDGGYVTSDIIEEFIVPIEDVLDEDGNLFEDDTHTNLGRKPTTLVVGGMPFAPITTLNRTGCGKIKRPGHSAVPQLLEVP